MTTLLTDDQKKKIEDLAEREALLREGLIIVENILEAKKTEFFDVVTEINNTTTKDLFNKTTRNSEGQLVYSSEHQELIDTNVDPYLYVNRRIQDLNLEDPTSPETVYNNLLRPYLQQKFDIEFEHYSDSYRTHFLAGQRFFLEDRDTSIQKTTLPKIKELYDEIENLNREKVLTLSRSVYENIKQLIIELYSFSYMVDVTIVAFGGGLEKEIEGLTLPQLNYNLNSDFSMKFREFAEMSLITAFRNIEKIIKEFENLTEEDIKEVKELIRLKAIEDEDIADSTNLKERIDTAKTTSEGFKGHYETLVEVIKNVLDNQDDYYNKLINLTDPTQKQNTITAAKASGYNIFQYIFNSDTRLISLYNQPKFRSAISYDYTDFGPYSPTYYEDWKSDYEKLIEGKPNYIDLKDKLDEINSYFEVEKLLENDVEEVSSKINSLITTLKAEVLPSIRTMFGHLVFIKDLNDYSEVTGITYDPELYTPFYRRDKPEGVLDEEMVVLNLRNAVNEAVTPLTNLITNLETLLSELKTDTIEDLIRADPSIGLKDSLDSVTSMLEVVESLQEESNKLCENIEATKKEPLTKFTSSESNEEGSNIYNLMYTESSVEVYKKMKDSLIHEYKPLNTKISNGKSEEIKKQSVEINKNNWYEKWCKESNRFDKTYETRTEPLKEQLNVLKTTIEEFNSDGFSKAKEKALNIIETDLHPDIALYFIFTEIYDVNNSNERIKTNAELYVKANTTFNFDEIASLKFNSFEIIQTLIQLHKSITELKFSDPILKINEQTNSELSEVIEKKNEELEKEVEKQKPNLPKENWGIRISPANAFKNVKVLKKEPAVDNSGKPTKEEKVNTTTDVFRQETTAFGKSWYMMLLPTMTSNLPVTGGSQAPGAQPGLNFRIVNSLVKHKIPGFGPVYQPMGIDTINCTIVGCFTGADGSDKYKIGNVDNFSEGGYNYSNDLFGLNGEIGNQSRFIDNVVHRFDSFENFQSFYNEIIQSNKEIEVEINLKKNTNVLANGSEGIFRDATTGNPKFKGYIKRFDSYYVRDDRTWYIMDVQLTTNHIINKKCLNLTNIVEEAVPNNTVEETLGITPFNLIAECLFKNTPGVGGPPKLPELIEFGPGNDARRVFIGSRAGEFAVNWKGVTVQQKGNQGEKLNRLSINKDGYSVKYEIIERGSSPNYRILGKPYLTPLETYKEIQNEVWDVDLKMLYVIVFNCIKDFLSRQSPNPDQLLDTIDSPVIELHRGLLKDKEIPGTGNSNRKGLITDGSNINLVYNKITGNLLEKDRSFKEYNPKVILNPKPLHKGVLGQGLFIGGILAGGDRAVRYKKHIELFNVLNAEALLEFNKNEELEQDCENKSKEKAKALSEKEEVNTIVSRRGVAEEEIDIGITFTKNDLQTKLKTYIENNHKEFIQQQVITYNNSNKSRLYFVEDIRTLSFLTEVSSQFFVDSFTIIDNEDSYFRVDVSTKSLKGLRYITPANSFALKILGGVSSEKSNRLVITIEKKDNKAGRILITIPYSQFTKPVKATR